MSFDVCLLLRILVESVSAATETNPADGHVRRHVDAINCAASTHLLENGGACV